MARKARTKPDVYPAPSLTKKVLKLLKGLLVFVGKPFYFLLTYLTVFCLSLFLVVGQGLGNLIKVIFKILTTPLPKIPRIKIPKPTLRIRISLKFLVPLLTLILIAFSFWLVILKGLPSPQMLITRDQEISTKIYDRNGVLLYKIYKNKNRTPVPLSQIPDYVRAATLAAEDAEFYNHLGFSIRGITRSIIRNIKKGELTGGSTITQQLVKNALLTPEKTLARKIKEIILSVETEVTFSKDQILEMYLNEVSYGGCAYGIQEASRQYFGKDVDELSIAEAALLAGLPKSPTKFSPFGPNPELAYSRQREVLRLMAINGFITSEQEEEIKNEKIKLAPNRTNIKAPHFVMYVRQALVEKYGEELVEKGGLEVTTTLDYSIQKMAEEAVAGEVNKLASLKVGNGAALVLDPKNGEVLAMVGSKDYFDTASDGNVNIITALRQPGSSIKVVNYAYALGHGYTPATILEDSPVTFSVAGLPPYSPRNYDGAFRGKLTLRSALAQSRNVPAVKVLASYGVGKMIEMGTKMGITTWGDPSRYGLSLTLGGGEIKLIDLARVYATIANYGRRPEITTIIKISDKKGKVLEDNRCAGFKLNCDGKDVLDPRIAFILTDILKDNPARTPAFGANSSLVIPGHPEVAVKTGTSNDLKDNLTLGFNQNYLVATWVGNNDNFPMARIASGVTGAAPIFNKIMSGLLVGQESVGWDIPQGVDKVTFCTLTASLPCSGCPTRTDWFLQENVPKKACLPEQIIKIQEEKRKVEGQVLEPAARTEFVN